MTEDALLELPHKVLLGAGLLPDTEPWPGERRQDYYVSVSQSG